MRKRWKVIAVVVAVIGLVSALLFIPLDPVQKGAPIDYEAELRRLTVECQGADDSADNGWGLLMEMAADAERIMRDIERREHDTDEAMKLSGREAEIEPWFGRVPALWMCEARTPRDERVTAEFWSAIDAERVLDRLDGLRTYELFVMSFDARLAQQVRLGGGAPSVTDQMSPIRRLALTARGDIERAMVSGDWDRALVRLDDALCLHRILSCQASTVMWLTGRSILAGAFDSIAEHAVRVGGVPAPFLRAAMKRLESRGAVSFAHVVQTERLEGLEMIDAAVEIEKRMASSTVWSFIVNRGLTVARAREIVEERTRVALAMRDLGPREVEVESVRLRRMTDGLSGLRGLAVQSMASPIGLMGSVHEAEMELEVVGLLIALALHTHDHGAPPDTLDALVPAYLAALPVDPFAPDGRFRYIPGPTMRNIVVYTVGWDGEDNGGRYIPERADRALTPSGNDGLDYVFTRDPCEAHDEEP